MPILSEQRNGDRQMSLRVCKVKRDWSSCPAMQKCKLTQVRNLCGGVHGRPNTCLFYERRIYPATAHWEQECFIHNKTRLENTLGPLEQNDQQINQCRCVPLYPTVTTMSEEVGCSASFCLRDVPEQGMLLENDGVRGRGCSER